jgi:hypothetical protein
MRRLKEKMQARQTVRETYQLHERLIDFGSEVQDSSTRLYQEKKHISRLSFDLGAKIGASIIRLHRANRVLVDSGWPQATPLLLRSMMESTVNYMTVQNSDEREFMAFKYFSHDFFRVMIDPEASEAVKEKTLSDIRLCINFVNSPEARIKAEELTGTILRERHIRTFWFQRQYESVKDCILAVADPDMRNSLLSVYRTLSMSIHGTHMGMVMFSDDRNGLQINPTKTSQYTIGALLVSCKLLWEFFISRCHVEGLEVKSSYMELLDRAQHLYETYRSTYEV